ncbi:DUF3265 domain-containing protein [Vibrio furnissii]|nr:DUF3265 domain-containing protein [Vibrio furnissii]UON51178.1 DUF3265 domain-containing protein [Vibrio furnissii]
MTKRSSGTHAAWHFWFAVSFCGESGLRKVSLYGIHPLTRRYAYKREDSRYIGSEGTNHHPSNKRV